MVRATSRPPVATTLIDPTNASNFTEVFGAGVTRTTDTTVTYGGQPTTRVFVPGALATIVELGVISATSTIPYLSTGNPVGGQFGVLLRTDRPTRFTGGSFYVGDATYSNFGVSVFETFALSDNWTLLITRPTWTPTGSPTYSGLRRTKLRLTVTAGDDANVWVAGYWAFQRHRAAFVLTCDDGYDEFYSYLWPACVSRGVPVSMSISSGLVNTAGFVTTAQCREMQADPSGLVELVNHARTNNSYAGIGLAAYLSDVLECRQFLTQECGATRGASQHVYVQGQFDAALQQALIDNGFHCAREVGASNRAWNRANMFFNPRARFALPASCNLEASQPLATVRGFIDNAIATGGLFVAMGHRFEGAAGVLTYSISDMNALLDFVVLRARQGLIDLLRMSDIVPHYVQGQRLA